MDTRRIVPPTLIFAAFVVLYLSITLINNNNLLFRPVWDIDHYRTIAATGYEARPCDPAKDYPMGDICGNVGWFPAWPMALKIFSVGQVDIGIKILPYLFALLGFVLFYNLLLRLADAKAALMGTAALAATPTAFYYLTGFPYSFILFLFAAYLYYLYHPEAKWRRYLLPSSALLISLSYPSGFLTAIIPSIMILNEFRKTSPRPGIGKTIGDLAYHIIPFALGPLLLSTYFYFKFDDFMLITHFQAKYHRSWAFPLTVIWESFRQFPALYVENCSVLWYGLIFLIFAPYRTRPELVGYFLLLYLFSPATGSVVSVYRHYLLLFPAVIIIALAERPRWLKIAYLALGLFLALALFYPIFMNGRLI
jgi:hypothetical protein